tara:strand:- start:70 stop:252 length:183 start_codon:yes stop_codon:yes gene_type:complete
VIEELKSFWNLSDIVFAHYSNHLGQTVYKFLGEFKVSATESDNFSIIFKRTKTRINFADI